MIKKIPNILTMSRIIILPAFLLIPYYQSDKARLIFLLLFTYASITDFLDGYLARKHSIITTFGRIFDPVADKALILVLCIVLLVSKRYMVDFIFIPIVFILLRELIISGIRENVASLSINIKVSKLAKYKTCVQMLALGFLIMGSGVNLPFQIIDSIGIVLLYLSLIITIITSVDYYMTIRKKISS